MYLINCHHFCRQSSHDLSPWTLVGTVLLAIFVICGTVVGIFKYRRRKHLRRHGPFSPKNGKCIYPHLDNCYFITINRQFDLEIGPTTYIYQVISIT